MLKLQKKRRKNYKEETDPGVFVRDKLYDSGPRRPSRIAASGGGLYGM